MMGASLHELRPGSSPRLHMHYGAEEMFFVVNGRPTFERDEGKQLAPGDVVFPRTGVEGCTRSRTTPTNPRASSRSAQAASPCRRLPGARVRIGPTRDPELDPDDADPGIIARFELPTD